MNADLPRVLHVIGPMTVGGAQTQLLGLVRAAHGVYWHASVCATSPGELVDDFLEAGIETLVLPRWGRPGILRARKLWRFVGERDFDVVNGHLWQANAYARLACIRPRRPAVVIVEHNVEVERSIARRAVDRLLAPWTDAWVAVTEAMHEFIVAHHPTSGRPVVRIPLGLDQSVFCASGPPDNPRVRIGSMGRFAPEKGFDVLIEAVRLLAEAGLDVEVEIAGTGPLLEEMQQIAEGLPVRFLGAVTPGSPAADFMRSLDVFVLPSTHREARPVVVLEALSCGIPVVATDIPGMEETTAGGATIVAPNDAQALADGIVASLSDPDARSRAASAASTILGFDEVAQQYRSLFDLVLHR